MSSEENKISNIKHKRINTNIINDELSSIIDIIIEDDTYQEGKNRIQELFKFYISNEKIINLCLTIINNIIILKGNNKHKILSVIPEICQINPKAFFTHVDMILSIFQSCLTDDNSPYYSQISQYFGDTVKALLIELNSENYNTYIINSNNNQNMKNNLNNLFLVYTKFKLFCLSNIKSNNTGCQICGTLCLTSFIENCSFNYINNENLKCIFDILNTQINNPNYPGKLEILNCFISLVFCSEEKYIPYSITTLNIIIKFITDPEWLIRKFALNIIYTMLYYCKKEILEKKEFIIENLNLLKNETNIEVKEIAEQIYKMINEDESTNMSYNNRIIFLSDSLIDSNNSKFSSGNESKKNYKNNNSMCNKPFQIEEEKNKKEIVNQKNKTSSAPGISKKKLQNSFIKKNKKNKNEIAQIKAKSDQKRKTINKYNDIMGENNMNNSSSKKLFPKLSNNSNNNVIKGFHSNKKRNVFSDNIPNIQNIHNKTRNKKVPPSRNSVDKFYEIKKKDPISMILKKRNILGNNNNSIAQVKNTKLKPKEKQNFNIYSLDKTKRLIGFKQKYPILSIKKNNNHKPYSINNNNKNSKSINIKPNNSTIQQKIKGRNDIIKQNNFISNTTININNNYSVNNRNIISLNKIPSFGPGSEEDINNPLYSEENSENMNNLKNNNIQKKDKLIKLQKHNKHNYSFEEKKTQSKNNFLNKSLENNILNFSGNELYDNDNDNKELDNIIKIHNTTGNNIQHYKKNKSKSKQKFNSKKNNKIIRITKMNKNRISADVKNSNFLNNKYNYNYDKDSQINQIDAKYKFSPGSQLKDSLELHQLFHSFSNNDKNQGSSKIDNKNKIVKNDSNKIKHKVNHSLQINNNGKNNNNTKIKIKNKNTKNAKNKKVLQIHRKSYNHSVNNNNNKDININTNKPINDNNNIIISNNVTSIGDNIPLLEVKNDDLNFELISKNDTKRDDDNEMELKFKEYKNETSKIINDLKMQVNILKATLGNFEESTKQKEKLTIFVKNNNYIQAIQIAVEMGNIQDIYYVIKKYQLSLEKEDIPIDLLGNIMKILCEDILSCENLRLITIFIINNICDKNIIFDNALNKEIFSVFIDLHNKRKELCFMKKDITNILKIANYFSINK